MDSNDVEDKLVESDIDVLKVYFGDPIQIDEKIVIHQPTIGQIVDFGELKFWVLANRICANPTSMRLELWDAGIDWCTISDFDLFISIIATINKEESELLFGDLEMNLFRPIVIKTEGGEEKPVLIYLPDPSIQIDENLYKNMVGYLRIMFNVHPKVEKAKGQLTKEWMINEERIAIENEKKNKAKNDKWKPSVLFPLISAALNHPGFKYKKSELKDVHIFEFMDSIKRLQIYENTTALIKGMYSGMIDTKNIKNEEINWVKDMYSS